MTLLSVNINKVATLRNSRGKDTPNLMQMTKHILSLGAKAITVHPRPDERHIKQTDVFALKENLAADIEFNIEGYPSNKFLKLIKAIKPSQCTLVPDPPEALTSNAGWDIVKNFNLLEETITQLRAFNVRSSIFIDPTSFSDLQFEQLKTLKPDRVELYTEDFADAFSTNENSECAKAYSIWAEKIHNIGIKINAGHDLNQKNLAFFLQKVPQVCEVSIGHAIFCEALYEGIDKTIANYLKICGQ